MDTTAFQYGQEYRRGQLNGILTDCILVYKRIKDSGTDLNNNENEIRDEVTKYLEDDNYKDQYTSTVKFFHVDTEVREGKNGRIDIRFLQVNPYKGSKKYFTIECKRLDGKAFLSKEYVIHGIERFTKDKKYSTPQGCNAMMGFIVRTLNVDDTCKTINTHLTTDEYLSKIQEELPEGCYKFESRHIAEGTITLLHLWMDFTSCIKKEDFVKNQDDE